MEFTSKRPIGELSPFWIAEDSIGFNSSLDIRNPNHFSRLYIISHFAQIEKIPLEIVQDNKNFNSFTVWGDPGNFKYLHRMTKDVTSLLIENKRYLPNELDILIYVKYEETSYKHRIYKRSL